ncbi:discoidin domain-containing protein [Rubritalea tangerina]|uniref:Discoidin domain-containing protein n=1 Tax=Rubritalea tangerina TaxID=430798 RepID=A0ABW4ZD44_9BACT
MMKKPILSLLAAGASLLPLSSPAERFTIPGAEAKVPANTQHGAAYTREHWTTKSNTKAWVKDPISATALPPNGTAKTTLTLPEKTGFYTPNHEPAKDKHERYALFVGVELPSDLPANGALALVTPNGKRLAVSKFSQAGNSASEVAWIVLPHELAIKLYGKPLDLHLKANPGGPLVFSNVHTILVPETAEKYMVNKSNGRRGPDKLQVGALGFTGLTIHNYAPLPVFSVRDGGPAANAGLKKGDVILAINGHSFTDNTCDPGDVWLEKGHEPVIARQVFNAFLAGKNTFTLDVADAITGKQRSITLNTKAGAGFEGFPLAGAASERFYDDLIETILDEQRDDGSWTTSRQSIATSFAMMGLLGKRDVTLAPAIHKAADWLLSQSPETMAHKGYWDASYIGMAVAEYALATGDLRAIQWMDRTLNPVNQGSHVSKWETPVLGHGPGGLPYGNKSLLAPLIHMLVFDALAERAGIDHGLWDYYWPYVESCWSNPAEKNGHGSMGYNLTYKDKGEFWSRTGLTMIATQLRNDKMHVHNANRDFMRTTHGWMRNSHAYGAPGNIWGMIALAFTGEGYADHMMDAWAPIIAAQWEPGYGMRFTMPHMGAPYMEGDAIYSYPMATFMSFKHKGLHITGATDKGWLPQNPKGTLPETQFTYSESGKLTLRPLISDSVQAHFTLDGSAPTTKSPIWHNSYTIPEGSVITARYIAKDGRVGNTTRISSRQPEPFTVIEANGWPDPKLAIQRASYAFDYDATTTWRSNNGEGATEGPWVVTIQRKQNPDPLRGFLLPIAGKNGVKAIKVEASNDKTTWTPLFDGELDKSGELLFSSTSKHPYLRFTISALQEAKQGLVLADVTPLDMRPQLTFIAPGRIEAKAPNREFGNIHFTTDGQVPTQKSPKIETLLWNVPEGGLVIAKAFNSRGQSSPASHLVMPGLPGLPKVPQVTVSSVYGNGSLNPTEITDGNLDSYWHGAGSDHPHTVVLAFDSPINFNGIWQVPRTSGARNGRITQFKVSVSDDMTNWTDVHHGHWNYNGDQAVESHFARNATGKFVKLTSLAGFDKFANIGELGFYNLSQKDWTQPLYASFVPPATQDKTPALAATQPPNKDATSNTQENSPDTASGSPLAPKDPKDFYFTVGGILLLMLILALLMKKK